MKSDTIKVLDHGSIRLVDSMGSDLSIVRNARVLPDAEWRDGNATGSDAWLINYLWKNYHSTPFESVELSFYIEMPIFAVRQFMRHRTFSYNEQSARYRELFEIFYLPEPDMIGTQAKTNKQARDLAPLDEDMRLLRLAEVEKVRQHSEAGFTLYRELLASGWPRELARAHLGLNTYTAFFAKANLLNVMRFLTLRCAPEAQYEIRAYADVMASMTAWVAPIAMRCWEASDRGVAYKRSIIFRHDAKRNEDG